MIRCCEVIKYNQSFYIYDEASCARLPIAAWPAAVAASLDRFRSASGKYMSMMSYTVIEFRTGFFLSLDLRNNSFDLFQTQVLRHDQDTGDYNDKQSRTVTFP